MKLYISGYGGNTTPSIGLFSIVDFKSTECIWSNNISLSSYLNIYDDILIGISELETTSAVHLFKRTSEGYSHMDTREIDGGSLCHISYLPINKILVGACYESGHIFSIEVSETGFGKVITSLIQGSGDPTINKGSLTRAHCVIANKAETQLYSANIALDRIYKYKIIQGELHEKVYLSLEKGDGPRHIYINKSEDIMYVITEYSNKIFIVSLRDNKMNIINSVSILPENFEGKSFGSSLCTSLNEKFLYAANRGSDTIAVFRILSDGNLIKVSDSSCYGKCPRHISLVGDGNYLAIANQDSDNVSFCKVDPETGNIIEEMSIPFYKPSFVY